MLHAGFARNSKRRAGKIGDFLFAERSPCPADSREPSSTEPVYRLSADRPPVGFKNGPRRSSDNFFVGVKELMRLLLGDCANDRQGLRRPSLISRGDHDDIV